MYASCPRALCRLCWVRNGWAAFLCFILCEALLVAIGLLWPQAAFFVSAPIPQGSAGDFFWRYSFDAPLAVIPSVFVFLAGHRFRCSEQYVFLGKSRKQSESRNPNHERTAD